MKHLFVPYELALLAKEKGFNEPCLAAYKLSGDRSVPYSKEGDIIIEANAHQYANTIKAPLYQQLVDWFRDEHKIHFCVTPPDGVWKYTYEIKYFGYKDQNGGTGYNSYNEALNAFLTQAFKLI